MEHKKIFIHQRDINDTNNTTNFRAVIPKSYSVHNALKLAPQVDTTDRSLVINGQRGQFDSHVSRVLAKFVLHGVTARLMTSSGCYTGDPNGD